MAEENQNTSPTESDNQVAEGSLDSSTQVTTSSDELTNLGNTASLDDSQDINAASTTTESSDDTMPNSSKPNLIYRLLNRFNPYIFLLVLLLIIAVAIILIAYFGSQKTNTSKLVTQNLSAASLQSLAKSNTNVGNSSEVLNIQSSTIFDGNVLTKQSLQVAGNLTVGGTLAINTLSVNGTGQFNQLNINKNLSVAGDSNLQGNLNVSKNLQVNGGATFGGGISAPQITTSNLQLNGNLTITHHIDTGGPIPSAKSAGSLGSGGTVNISGSDTSGNVNINTGNGTTPGCFVTINFASAFSKTPYVEVTPVGSSAGGLEYYITRTNSSFSICDATAPPADTSFSFDYFSTD